MFVIFDIVINYAWLISELSKSFQHNCKIILEAEILRKYLTDLISTHVFHRNTSQWPALTYHNP